MTADITATAETYAIARRVDGSLSTFVIPVSQCLHLGAGVVLVWSGESRLAFAAECARLGVPMPELDPLNEADLLKPITADSEASRADLAATVEVLKEEVSSIKADLKGLRALPSSPPVVAERVTAAEQRADANALSMGRMVMDTKNELTLQASGLQAQIDGLASQLAALKVKVG